MKLAWFRPTVLHDAGPFDDTALLIAELSAMHEIDIVTATSAHDFVWKHFRSPYALCVFELDNTPAHGFIWPYLHQYSGVVLLRSLALHDSRARILLREGRADDYAAEYVFNEGKAARLSIRISRQTTGVAMLRTSLMSSRVAIVPHRGIAEELQGRYPPARVRYAPLAAPEIRSMPREGGDPVTFGVLTANDRDVVLRALVRAQEAGANASVLVDEAPDRVLRGADVVIALVWSPFCEPLTPALAALATGKPTIVMETETSADWPALDPQTWQPRGHSLEPPIVVSIDPRDEEHSLMLAIQRLSAHAELRQRLGSAGRAWWQAHASVQAVTDVWTQIVSEAVTLEAPPRPEGWPAHLLADGSERAREILADFGVPVDFLNQ